MVEVASGAMGAARVSWFAPEQQTALLDFWAVYDAEYASLAATTLEIASRHEEFAPIVKALTPAQLTAENEASRERLRRAVHGEWEVYENTLRAQGTTYAAMGVSLRGWYDIVKGFHTLAVPRVVAAYCASPERLTAALLALQSFVDRAMVTIADSYFEAKNESLRRTEAQKSAIISACVDPIVVIDDQGRVTELNPAAQRAFGRERHALLGMHLADLLASPWAERHRAGLEQWLVSGSDPLIGARVELEALGNGESRFPAELTVVATPLHDGRPAFTCFFRDLTSQRRAELARQRSIELEAQNDRIREANRLKSEFLANMSHELRTPLNSIIGFAGLLHDGQVEPTSPEHHEFTGDILQSGKHLLELINDVLDLAKVEAGKLNFYPEDVDLQKLVTEVVGLVRTAAAAKRLIVEVDVSPGVRDVNLDPGRMKQVLYNYLSNAFKFTPVGGRVTVRAFEHGSDQLRIEVSDTGAGIAQADLRRLFVEFQQLDAGSSKHRGGTGLGLALTKRLVEAQEGSVGVTSDVGLGSTFFAILPRRSRVAHRLPAPRVLEGPRVTAPRILVVEDDLGDQDLVVRTLTGAGYAVETAATGAQAIARARERRFDAITLDLLLPDMSGLDVLSGIRAGGESSSARVLIVSVIAERQAIAGVAVDDLLAKPIHGDDLVAALRRAGVDADAPGHILVVDDDASTLRLMETTLSQLGYGVHCANDGVSALRSTETNRPRAIVLDLVMPNMDGFEFLGHFRAKRENWGVPVIVWTMKDLTRDECARLRRSAECVMQKGRDGTSNVVHELRALLPIAAGEGPDHGK